MNDAITAQWYKRPYTGAQYTELKKHPAYFILEDNGKDGLLAFRVVDGASELAAPCNVQESKDLEQQRLRRQGLRATG